MKKIIALLLVAVTCLTLFGCNRNGDLGKQTTIDAVNNVTIVPEVILFQYKKDQKDFENNDKAKFEGFKVGKENAKGEIQTKDDALAIAKEEVTSDYNQIRFAYDRTRGIWRIKFSKTTVTEEKTEETTVETIYVDEDGYTLVIVK